MASKTALLKFPKKVILKVRFYVLAAVIVGLGTVFLLGAPNLISLTQTSLAYYINNLPIPENPENNVAGVQKSVVVSIQDQGLKAPVLTAASVLVLDVDSGKVLYEKNSHQHLLPASTTKLVTALVAIDYYKSGDSLTVTSDALVGGSTMGLESGEKLSFRSLLYGMLLNSGNDAAYTLALNYPGGYNNFITQMNNKVNSLGLVDTHFDNPAGFDSPTHYSSAYDLAQIAAVAIQNPTLATIVSTKQTSVSSTLKQHLLENVDSLLEEKGFIGIKTGYTENAGENFVGLVKRNNHELITVVLKSTDRFGETEKLADWAYQNFIWKDTQD